MKSTKKKETESYGRIVLQVFLTGVAYYAATEIAWALCFPNSKVSLLFPPHAVLVVILLLVPVRHSKDFGHRSSDSMNESRQRTAVARNALSW